MLYLNDLALDVAQNFAHNEDSDQELAAAVDMAVMEIESENGEPGVRAVNIFLPTRDTKADPAICQVAIKSDGTVFCDSPFDEATDAVMISDQIEDARKRIAFCEEALHNMGAGYLIES